MPRIAAPHVRLAVLMGIVAGHLPVPVVHSHAALAAAGSACFAQHMAVFHGGELTDPTRSHVHLVPPMFFVGGGLGDATGEDVPDPGKQQIPTQVVVQFDAPQAVLATEVLRSPVAPVVLSAGRPTHFMETFCQGRDLGGLLGVCRC